ncbi:D-alanyl-D-alanine carboxypeptidase [Actinacidiphila yanglinensis]|uniref:D-alanyl-D-alanine carboxypeptidase n=1 Tax=Actinacidiphila yanglinensis TaxID=310779 RepID=A0A1H5T7X1_9ACTN|nr:serine hydrolase domain-containing protein [Actinacidiphila yanglinensis]SEF58889.1 D-alanyl-D-alanine carboxypeptidase [Actinacidiphila yanglinensis]
MRVARTGKRAVVGAIAVVLAASALAAVPAGAYAGGGADRTGGKAAAGGYSTADLRKDLAAVRAAGGGDVNVVARVDRQGDGPLRARYGTAGLGSKAPVPWDPEFRTASTSKTFTAVVVLQLVAEHRLSLDDTVDHWLPGVVGGNGNDGRRVTVRDLLQQTSGIYDYIQDPAVQDRLLNHFDENRFDDTPPEQLVAVAMSHPPVFTPGSGRWAYSNTNYLLAAMIAEKASGGQSWQEMVEHRVIAPLGLRHTYIPGANPYLVGPHERVTVTGPDGNPLDLTEQSLQHTADSGVVSTPADLDTFFRALAGGRLLSAAQLAEMRTTVPYDDLPVPPAGTQGGYGLGLRVLPLTCGGTDDMHEGDGLGVYTRPAVSADGRRAVTVSITTTTALIDEDKVNRAVEALTDHALCDRAGS